MDAEEARRKRREKLLNRGKQLDNPDTQIEQTQQNEVIHQDQNQANTKPVTQQNDMQHYQQADILTQLKEEEQHRAMKKQPEQIHNHSHSHGADQCCDHDHSQQQSHRKPRIEDGFNEDGSVNFKRLFQLQEDNEKHIKLQRVIRFLFATLTGVWFHLFFNVFEWVGFNFMFFVTLDIGLISWLIYYQKSNYTWKIARIIKKSERLLEEQQKDAQEQEENVMGSQVNKAFDVMDLLMAKSDKLQTIQNVWKYLVSHYILILMNLNLENWKVDH
eukprot:403359218